MNDPRFGLHNQDLVDILEKHVLNSGGLAIKTGSSATVKTANDVYYMIDGALYKLAAADMTALAGTVTNAYFNVFVFAVDSDGNVSMTMGTEATTLAGVVFPTTPSDEAVIGFVIINPTGTGNFVGGTTALDDGTVTPGAVYINAVAPQRYT